MHERKKNFLLPLKAMLFRFTLHCFESLDATRSPFTPTWNQFNILLNFKSVSQPSSRDLSLDSAQQQVFFISAE